MNPLERPVQRTDSTGSTGSTRSTRSTRSTGDGQRVGTFRRRLESVLGRFRRRGSPTAGSPPPPFSTSSSGNLGGREALNTQGPHPRSAQTADLFSELREMLTVLNPDRRLSDFNCADDFLMFVTCARLDDFNGREKDARNIREMSDLIVIVNGFRKSAGDGSDIQKVIDSCLKQVKKYHNVPINDSTVRDIKHAAYVILSDINKAYGQ